MGWPGEVSLDGARGRLTERLRMPSHAPPGHDPPMSDVASRGRWTPRTAVSRFAEIAREDGARILWFRLWGELCYRRLGVFELPLAAPPPEVPARVPLAFAPLADGDAAEFASLGSSDPAETEARLAAGHGCFLARAGQELVGACWIARGELRSQYLGRRIELAPDEACSYETYTAPPARGQGVGPALRAWVAADLRDEGCTRLLATVDPDNAPAIRLVEKLGYRRIGTIGWLGVGPWRRAFCRMRAGARPPGLPSGS